MGQMKTKFSSSATGLFFLLLMIVSFSSCTRTQKDIIPSAEYAPYVLSLIHIYLIMQVSQFGDMFH